MRKLNQLEKELLSTLRSNGARNIIDLLDPFLEGIRIRIDRQNEAATFLFEVVDQEPEDDELNQIPERITEITKIVVTAINLIDLLNREGLVILFQNANEVNDTVEIGQGSENMPFITNEFPDPRVSSLIARFSTMEVIITPEAESYVDNNFRTHEDLKHQQSLKIAWYGVFVALAAVVINMAFNIYEILCH